MPVISIIVPIYNAEKHLRRCLDSILAQTFMDFECILINDGSSDNCSVICEEYAQKDKRFVVIHQQNKGVSAARNAGLDVAKGEWVGFVDSDDWIDIEMFSILYEYTAKYNADISICGVRIIPTNEQNKYENGFKILNQEEALLMMFQNGKKTFGGYSCNKLVKANIISQNNLRFDSSINYMEDLLFFYQVFKHAKIIVYAPNPYYNYYTNSESITKQWGLTQAAKTAFSVMENLISLEKNYRIKKQIVTKKILFALILCNQYIKQNDCTNKDFEFLKNILTKHLNIILLNASISLYQKINIFLLLISPSLLYRLIKKRK